MNAAESSSAPSRRSAKLAEMFGCDLRSLGLLRVGLGLAVLADVLTRATDIRWLYTDAGVLPRDLLRAAEGREVMLSAHYWASSFPWLQIALFGLTALAAIALAVGWRTRLSTLACWYLVASVQIRQPLVYMGGDSMLRMLLFWSLFLPLGGRFSIDAARGRAPAVAGHILSVGTVALLLQVCLMYWATGMRKTGPLWASGRAIFYALNQERATTLGQWLLAWPAVLEWITYGTLALELFGPFLAFVPLATAWFRMVTVGVFWLFHLGLASTMNIGLFPVFSMVGWLAFLPARFWETAGVPATHEAASVAASVVPWRARLASGVAAVCLLYVVMLLTERAGGFRLLPSPVLQVGRALRLQQTWNMFAPDPGTVTADFAFRKRGLDRTDIEVPAATSFRGRLFVSYAGARLREGNALGQSLARFVGLQCVADPALDEVALVQHARRITDEGAQPLPDRVVVSVRCGIDSP